MAETTLKKGNTVRVQTRTGGGYSYKYTDLAQIHEYLESKGWRYEATIKRVEGDDYMFITKIDENGNKSEPMQEAKIPKVEMSDRSNAAQEYGSALTYARRYSLLMAYGLATEDDDAQVLNRPKSGASYAPSKPAGGSSRLNFDEVKGNLDLLVSVEEVDAYAKEIAADYPNLTDKQKGALKRIFQDTRDAIEAGGANRFVTDDGKMKGIDIATYKANNN